MLCGFQKKSFLSHSSAVQNSNDPKVNVAAVATVLVIVAVLAPALIIIVTLLLRNQSTDTVIKDVDV